MPGIAFKGSGAEVRVSSSSVGRPHADQTFPSARRARAGSEGIKIKRLQQQHSFPGQMAVSLDFDDLSAPPQNQEPAEAAAVPQQSAFVGGLLGRSSVAQSPARQAWQPSAETERDPWASHGGPLTRHATAATEPTHGGQQPAPQPEPEVVPWAVTRTKITSSPAKHSVQIRIPNDRTAYVEPASDENAFAGRRGTDGGVPRSKLAMAEVRQRRVREKQKKLAEQGKQSKLRELEEGIRSRRAAAAAAAAAAEVAAAEEAAPREMATATAAVAGEALRRPAARSPARSNRRGQPKSPSRASANQKAATKRLSQPVPRPRAANVPDPMNTAAAQNHSTLEESVPRQRAVPSARRPAKSTVDWDSLLVQSDVDILDAAIDNSTGKHQSAGSTRTTHNMASDTVQSPESKRAAKARGSKPARDRRQTLDAAASPGGKQRADTPSVKTEGAVGQLKNTWQQLQHEPRGKRSSSASASTAPTFATRLGKPGRVLTSSKSTVSATKRNVRAAAASRSGSATQKAKQKRRASEVASTAQKNDSKHSLDLLLTDETAGSRSSSPLFRQQTQNTAPSPLNLGTYQVDKIESMLQELKSLLADHMQEEVLRAQEESEILELRKAAAHDRADAHLKRVLAHGDGGDENQEAHTMIAMRLADELAEIGKSTAHHRVASVRQKLNLQHWEERILKLCDEVDACRRGVRDVHANETTVRELMSAMQSGNDQRVALMDRLRRQFEDESQQLNRQQGSFNTLQQQHDPTTDAAAQEPRQLEPSARMNGVDIGEGGQTTNGAEHTVDESDSVDENSAEELMGDSLVEDVQALAEFLGIDPTSEPHLMWIARQCLDAQLPPAWSEYFEEATGNAYYYNELTKITTWDHPLDSHFKALVQEERLAHAARKVLSSTDYSTAARHVADSRRGAQAVVQSDAHVDVNNTQADANDHDEAIGQNGLSSKAAPPRARMVQSLNGKPLDLSDLNVSVSTTPAKDSPDRTKNAKMLSPKSLAAQIITLSSDSDTDQEQHAGLTGACMLGKLIPASTHPVVVSSPGYSDQSSLDVDALEKSLLEHHRSTSPSPHQGQSVMQHQTTAQNDEIMSDISAHSENSGDEDVLYPQSPHELALMAAKLDDDLDTSLSQTELDVIVQQLHRIEDEEDDAMCEQDRDSKAMAALRSIARRTDIPPPVASPGPSYVEPVLSPSRNKGISRDASEAGLSALRKMIKEALACTDIKTVQLMIQEVVTRGKQLRGEEQEALEPDMAKLIAAAHRMERTAVTSSEPDSDNGDEQYTDDDFEDEDEANAQVGTSAGSPTVAQKPPSSPVTPTIDPVQTSRYADPFILEELCTV